MLYCVTACGMFSCLLHMEIHTTSAVDILTKSCIEQLLILVLYIIQAMVTILQVEI